VRVSVPVTSDIGGKMYQFEPGVTYHEPADVKRILFSGGRLDPSCFDVDAEDSGLLPYQFEAARAISGSQAYCRDCGQRMNTRPTRSDDLLAEAEAV
jgi:hypothetical protein